tara:strand:- start:191 stop:508 length:318 start_codon:yes stop_codon:yes gene_type:complete
MLDAGPKAILCQPWQTTACFAMATWISFCVCTVSARDLVGRLFRHSSQIASSVAPACVIVFAQALVSSISPIAYIFSIFQILHHSVLALGTLPAAFDCKESTDEG